MLRDARWPCAVVTLFALFWPAPAVAGRPLDTEDTSTVDPGRAELELSGDFVEGPRSRSWSAKGVLSLGLLPGLEGRLESAVGLRDPEGELARAGVGDSLLGLKYRVLDETRTMPAVLGALTLRLPTGDEQRGLGAGGVDVGLLAAVSKALGPFLLTANAGYTFVTRDRGLDVVTLAGSLEYRAAARWSLVGEIIGTVGAARAPDTAVLRGGVVYAMTDRIKVDGAMGAGLTRGSSDVLVTVGVTIGLF
jgi:hypothetical protein